MSNNVQFLPLFDQDNDGRLIGFETNSGFRTLLCGSAAVLSADGIKAAGTTQATATVLTASMNNITSASAGSATGVMLPPADYAQQVAVSNETGIPIVLYANVNTADTLNGFPGSTGILLYPGCVVDLNAASPGAWEVQAASPVDAAYSADTATAGKTLTATEITGATGVVVLNLSGALGAGANAQLPTVASLLTSLHCPAIGSSYMLRVLNTSSGAFAWTVTTNTGWTLNGTMTIAQNTYREFIITITSLTTATIQSVGQVAVASV